MEMIDLAITSLQEIELCFSAQTADKSAFRVSINVARVCSHCGSLYGLEGISVCINLFIKAVRPASRCNLK